MGVFERIARLVGRHWRASLAASLSLATGNTLFPPASAFDLLNLFGLFGSEEAPPVSADAVAYQLSFEGLAGDKDLLRALQDVSILHRLRQEPPPDGDGVVRRAEADLPRLTEALWGAGYYDGHVSILIDEVRLAPNGSALPAVASRRAERYRGRAPVPVRILVVRGALFTLQSVVAVGAHTGAPFDPVELPSRVLRFGPDEPARSSTVVALEARLVDHFRARGHPFSKVARRDAVVDHRSKTLAVTLVVDPGPLARVGTVAVRGTRDVDAAVVRSFIYTEPGDPYSSKSTAAVRKSVARIEALGSVRVREDEALDAQGNLPLFVDVTERPSRLVGVSARYSTIDGPGVTAYWAHRNLFGGAERLRLDADLFFTNRGGRFDITNGKDDNDLDWSNLGGRFGASFLKPALWGTRNDFLLDAFVAREVTESYTSWSAGATAAIRHRFSDVFSIQSGLEIETGQARDVLGRLDYTLVGLPLALTYDSTDSLLDPTRGSRVRASVTPYPAFLGSDPGIFVAKGQASTYYAFDEEARYVLAGRIGVGSIAGAALADIPANRRFYAGGGGSVRGYAYKTLGPKALGEPIGGRSLLEGSIEARIKVTETIGIVPFVDAGTAFASSLPNFGERIRVAAGLGLRYYTGIGPIRLDVAFPLNREQGDSAAAVYISLGQAF
jgi:translocation and assembly module TamA